MIKDRYFEQKISVDICSKCLESLHKNNKICWAIEKENRFCQKIIMLDNLAQDLISRAEKLTFETTQEEISSFFEVVPKHTKRDTYK